MLPVKHHSGRQDIGSDDNTHRNRYEGHEECPILIRENPAQGEE
jgi:hypothetical protein